jgi:hypothetical protein
MLPGHTLQNTCSIILLALVNLGVPAVFEQASPEADLPVPAAAQIVRAFEAPPRMAGVPLFSVILAGPAATKKNRTFRGLRPS